MVEDHRQSTLTFKFWLNELAIITFGIPETLNNVATLIIFRIITRCNCWKICCTNSVLVSQNSDQISTVTSTSRQFHRNKTKRPKSTKNESNDHWDFAVDDDATIVWGRLSDSTPNVKFVSFGISSVALASKPLVDEIPVQSRRATCATSEK